MANSKMSKSVINVGVDVGKSFLDVYIYEKKFYFKVENTEDGIKQLLNRLRYYRVARVVVEATGRYEFALAEACYRKSIPVSIVKPLRVRRYAGAVEQLAKTDKIDAQIIAEFAAKVEPEATPEKSKNLIAIKDLLARRRQLMEMRTQELNRQKIMPKNLTKDIGRLIKILEKEISKVEIKLQKHVDEESAWSEKQDLLKTAPGVGNTLVYTLLADLPEIGSLSNKEIGKLVGVAPMNRESGKMQGKRRVIGGRANVRTILYMATLSATSCNYVIRNFYQKLVAQGKHKKVALTACMRKFVTMLNAMVRDNKPWCHV